MRFSIFPTLLCVFTSVVPAVPLAIPVEDGEFELISTVKTIFEERFFPEEIEDFHNIIQKRNTELTIESLMNLLNRSGVIFDVLDVVAYSPSRIETIANFTAKQLGNINISSTGGSISSVGAALNFSRIYNAVMDSGIVKSLLDGMLLDEDYRPTLVKLVSRLMEGNKNLFLYLVQDIFKKSKRQVELGKRATSSLETFIGNIIASALSSSLVGGISNDVLVALNNTQLLTYTVKELIRNEGYQNMTAQFAIDIIRTGDLKINSQAINITKYADKALSNPKLIVAVVSQLLSGNINISGLGKYSNAVGAIIQGVEDNGVFRDLNQYVFSQSHTVSKPLIGTGNIVVPKTIEATTTTTTKGSSSESSLRSAGRTSSMTATANSTSLSDTQSAAEVASILSVLRASTGGLSKATTTIAGTESSSSFDINDIINQLQTETTGYGDMSNLISSSTASSATSDINGILGLLGAIGETNNKAAIASTSTAVSSSYSLSASNAARPNNAIAKMLVYAHALLLGGILLL